LSSLDPAGYRESYLYGKNLTNRSQNPVFRVDEWKGSGQGERTFSPFSAHTKAHKDEDQDKDKRQKINESRKGKTKERKHTQ